VVRHGLAFVRFRLWMYRNIGTDLSQ
jgi:hypothetical protein